MTINDGWYESYLGSDRLARFLAGVRQDRGRVGALVDWDREMRGELQKMLGEWEIALRNAYDRAISSWWTGEQHWLKDPASPVNREIMHRGEDLNKISRNSIRKAVLRTKPGDPIGRVIANLSLDFWRYLSVTAREKTLWVPALHRAFPKGSDRAQIDRQIDSLYRLRNRVAHHEPIFHKPIVPLTTSLVHNCELVRPELADTIVGRGTVKQLWGDRPIELR
ncbi:Abi family protein [Hamadaea sp. NPDC051192]|uniref:Abi family protein n=1 Tax=Hamadaea sp. NPDC051192 TaxID=3154940 RepID=UPI003430F467